MRRSGIVAVSLVAVSFLVGYVGGAPVLRAGDPPQEKPPADPPKGGEVKIEQVVTRDDRAKQLVKQLEDAVVRAKAATPVDVQLLQALMTALDQARALARPVKLDELTADEKKALAEDLRKELQGAQPPAPRPPQNDWVDKQLARAFEGADLSEEETIKATKIIGDWSKDYYAAQGDSKKSSDLKKRRDDDLEKALGKRKSQKVINNLNAMVPGRR